MSKVLFKKYRNKNSWSSAKKHKTNSCVLTNFHLNTNNDVEYFQADPLFDRFEGGNEQKEVFYDCFPIETEPVHHHNFLPPQLQVFEVINELTNPKEFKGLLKQIAFTAHVLHRSFCRAYYKARKLKESKNLSRGKSGKKSAQIFDHGDVNLKGLNANKQQNLKERAEMKETLKGNQDKNSFGVTCPSCAKSRERKTKENICSICFGTLEDENERVNLKNDPKNLEYFATSCVREVNLRHEHAKDLHLVCSERSTLLRSEKPCTSKAADDLETGQEATNVSSTDANLKQYVKLNPVCVNIPLNLRIDAQHGQALTLETDSSAGQRNDKLSASIKNPGKNYSVSTQFKQQSDISLLSQFIAEPNFSGNDTFYSFISNSDVNIKLSTEPILQTIANNENILNEILELLKRHFESLKKTIVTPTPQPLNETKPQSQSKGPQSSLNISPAVTAPYSKMDFTPTGQNLTPLMATVPAPSIVEFSSQFDPSIHAKKLRTELFKEVRAILEKTPATDALKTLIQTKRFPLPRKSLSLDYYKPIPGSTTPQKPPTVVLKTITVRSKSQNDVKPQIPPKPSAIPPLSQLPNQSELPSTSREIAENPELLSASSIILPPPPVPKLVSEAQQTDLSAVKASGHYKRNEIRLEIQEEMRELLQQNSSKIGVLYRAAERDEILQDFNKLIHPEKAEGLSPLFNREMATQNIRYLIDSDGPNPQTLKPSESQTTILENIRYILNAKNSPKTSKTKKYNKETKEKILEDLHLLLKPRKEKQTENREIRNYILQDLRSMLETGQQTFSPQKPVCSPDSGSDFPRAQQ